MKKRMISLVLTIVMLLSLFGCAFDPFGSKDNDGDSSTENKNTDTDNGNSDNTLDNGSNGNGDSENGSGDGGDSDDNGTGDSGDIDTEGGINLTDLGLSFYTDGGADVQLSLDNLRFSIALMTGSTPALTENKDEATAIFGVTDFSDYGASSFVGYVSVSYENGILSVLASDTESLNLVKDALLSFATEDGIVIPENLSERALFNKSDYRKGRLTLYTEEDAKTLPIATSILVNGKAVDGFLTSKLSYQVFINDGVYPTVTAVALHPGSTVEIDQASDESLGVATVKIKNGERERSYTVSFIDENATVNALVVQKGGAKGTVCFVIDDGTHSTAEFVRDNILGKKGYENVSVNFALITKKLATLKTTENAAGELVYDIDENGRYKYEEVAGEFDFWRGVLDKGNAYIVSHTHTHNPPGENDEGGIFGYKKNDGTWTSTSNLPKGHILAEITASNQIIEDVSGYASGTMVRAGVGASVSRYFYNLMLDSGVYFAARANSSDYVEDPNSLVYYYDTITNRAAITSYMIEHYASSYNTATVKGDDNSVCLAAGIDKWTEYIDHAIETGGWATFCIHEIMPDDHQQGKAKSGHYIYQTQAKALFSHANDYGDDIWIASYDEAAKYFLEWSTASVTAEVKAGNIIAVNLVTEETDERLNVALTVKVSVPDSFESVSLNGENVEIMSDGDGSKYVLVDVKPGETVLLLGTTNLNEEVIDPFGMK